MPIFNTACPRNCYSSCSFKVEVEANRIVNFYPDPANLATPEGLCLKGLSYFERANSPDRITAPLRKNKKGKFEKISWQEALEEISKKLKKYNQDFGPQSILFYSASGMAGLLNNISKNFWELYGGATTMYGDLCWPAGLEGIRLTLGENKHNAPWDIANAKLIVLWGKNPAETNIHQMLFIEKAQQAGAKLVVIDPRRTSSAEKADLHIQARPGTDGALALAISKILIDENWIDREFIAKYVIGFDDFRNSIEKWTVEKASEISGVLPEFITRLAKWIGTIKPMTLCPGYGMQRYTNGGQSIRCLLALNILTSNIGKPGACFHYANLQSYVFDSVKEPESLVPAEKPDSIFRRSVSMAKLGEDMLAQENPCLKMIWVERGNPISQNPDTSKVLKAFRELEFRVVIDQFITDTAMVADIILPAKNMFEQSDIIGSYWNNYVQLKPKILEPPAEVRPETEIYYHLAKMMNFNDEGIEDKLIKPGNEHAIAYLKKRVAEIPGLEYESLVKGPVAAPGNEDIAFKDLRFETPSGKIELKSSQSVKNWGVDDLPGFNNICEEELKNEYPLYLLTPNTKNRIHSQFGNLGMIMQVSKDNMVTISYEDAKNRDIKNDDLVEIFNNRGKIRLNAIIDHSLKKGCIVIPNGIWMEEGGSVNYLSVGRETDMGYGCAFHDNMVDLRKI